MLIGTIASGGTEGSAQIAGGELEQAGTDSTKTGKKADKNAAYNQNLEQGMNTLQQSDPALFSKIMTAGESGNGNSLVEDELQAYKEGDLTKNQAIAAISGAQSLANNNGGGRISKKERAEAKEVLGGSYIKGGQTRAGHAILKFLEDTSPIAQIVKGIKSTTSDGPGKETILQAGSGALSTATQQAMSDLEQTDPSLAQQFSTDASKKNGNAMAPDLEVAGEEAASSGGAFSDADAAALGSQIGQMGAGKVSKKDAAEFEAEFGEGTIDRGSTKAAKGWDKFETGMGNFLSSMVSPLTDGVGMIDQFAKGNKSQGLKDLGGMFEGVASDAALLFVPEIAPEVDGAEAAARAADGVAQSAEKGASSIGDILKSAAGKVGNGLMTGLDTADYGYNLYSMGQGDPIVQQHKNTGEA
ncbi:hypothetical protein JK164_11495 [Gluconobacter kondonii]|uniref:hypothetical protein n=1 Tax=Gluconobacter kondonii TaxID=941463 RepID=UPI001B8BA71D|nr:hypothetical protein [Gluconobacter kondonii]MBS1066559.1 hypothetical protein [Gluconobacter kondonii]